MGPEALCFRVVRPSVCACVRARAKAVSDRLAVDFWFYFPRPPTVSAVAHCGSLSHSVGLVGFLVLMDFN